MTNRLVWKGLSSNDGPGQQIMPVQKARQTDDCPGQPRHAEDKAHKFVGIVVVLGILVLFNGTWLLISTSSLNPAFLIGGISHSLSSFHPSR